MLNVIHVSEFSNYRGKLIYFDTNDSNLPFIVKRIYHISQVPIFESRGKHGHLELEQVIFAISGTFELKVWHNKIEYNFLLNDPSKGIHIPKKSWRELYNFSKEAVCLVLASEEYNSNDYYYDKNIFMKIVNS